MEIEVSVILPVFNIKKEFLSKCLDSFCNQSIDNYEIIMVDDGSTNEDTLLCIEECVKKDNKIRLIKQINSGVSVARNNGFKNSFGKYICFADPDDWVADSYLEDLLSAVKDSGADIAMADCVCVYSNHIVDNKFLEGDERELSGSDKNEILYQLIGKRICKYYPPEIAAGVVWGKIFKRSFLEEHGLEFIPGMTRMQDNIFCLYAIENAEKIYYLPKKLYFYRKEIGSACFKYSPKIVDYFEKYFDETKKYLDFYNKERVLYDALMMKELTSFNSFLSQYYFHKNNKKSKKEVRKQLNAILNEERYKTALKNVDSKLLTFQEKVFIYLLKHRMYWALRVLLNIRSRHKM